MTISSAKSLALSGWLPLFTLLPYWLGVRGNYSTNQLLLASAIALLVAAGLFLYVRVAREIERGSIVWGLLWIAIIALGAVGFISDAEPWGFPLFLFAIWVPVFTTCADKRRQRDPTKTLAPSIARCVTNCVGSKTE